MVIVGVLVARWRKTGSRSGSKMRILRSPSRHSFLSWTRCLSALFVLENNGERIKKTELVGLLAWINWIEPSELLSNIFQESRMHDSFGCCEYCCCKIAVAALDPLKIQSVSLFGSSWLGIDMDVKLRLGGGCRPNQSHSLPSREPVRCFHLPLNPFMSKSLSATIFQPLSSLRIEHFCQKVQAGFSGFAAVGWKAM